MSMGVKNNAPEGWVECTLGEVISTNDESLSKNYPHQEIIYIDTGSVTKNKIEAYQVFNLKDAPTRAKRLVRDGDIIYSTVRPDQEHYGYLVSPQINCVVSTGFCVIRAKNDSDSKFIYYFLTQRSVTKFLHTIGEQMRLHILQLILMILKSLLHIYHPSKNKKPLPKS